MREEVKASTESSRLLVVQGVQVGPAGVSDHREKDPAASVEQPQQPESGFPEGGAHVGLPVGIAQGAKTQHGRSSRAIVE